MKITSSFTAHTGQTYSVELDETDFPDGQLEGLSLPEKHKKMTQMADLMIVKRFKDTNVWPDQFADQMAANAVK